MEHGGDTSVWLTLAIVAVAFPITFASLWLGVIWMLSVTGGWREVAAHCRAAAPPPNGRSFAGISAMFGVVSYSNLLTVVVADEGLYLATPRLFKMGHEPLMIPWSAVRRARRTSFLGFDYVSFDVGETRFARVRPPDRVFEGAPVTVG